MKICIYLLVVVLPTYLVCSVRHILLEAVHRANVDEVKHFLSIDQEILSSTPPVMIDKEDDAHGRTPLLVCGLAPGNRDRLELGKDCVKIAKMLHKRGADMKHVDTAGWDAVSMGAVRGMTPFCRYLLKYHGLDVNRKDLKGRTALMKAAAHGYFDTFVMLFRRGARLEMEMDDISMTAMHYGTTFALQNPAQLDFFKNLTQFVSQNKEQNRSALQISQLPIHIDSFVDASGRTCLMYAAISNNIEVSKALLAVGADPRKTDNYGVSCITMTSDDTLRGLLSEASVALIEKEHSAWLHSSEAGDSAQEILAGDADSHDEF